MSEKQNQEEEMSEIETPLCQELDASPLDSNDIRVWRALAYRLERGLNLITKPATDAVPAPESVREEALISLEAAARAVCYRCAHRERPKFVVCFKGDAPEWYHIEIGGAMGGKDDLYHRCGAHAIRALSLESVREEAIGEWLLPSDSFYKESPKNFEQWWQNLPPGLKNPAVKAPCKRGWNAALQSPARVAEGGPAITEEKIGDLLAELEILNFMDVGAPRHHRKKEYEHIREFLISLAPGVVEPNFEKAKK